MTITALTCPATSADLLPYHPRIFDAVSPAQRDYATQISLAFTQLLNDLLNSGFDAARLPNSAANIAAMKPLVCHKALSIIFLDLGFEDCKISQCGLHLYNAPYAIR